jgi:Uma2 family endonuclease
MATSTRVPLELYLRSDEYEPAAEYVDGEIEERPMGENDHSAWQLAIQKWFLLHEDEWNIFIRPELRVQTNATRFRIPDVAILDAAIPTKPITTHPPLAVFEVLSPEDTMRRVMRKLGDYAAMGIPQIWVIDPETKDISRFEDGQLLRQSHFSIPENGIDFEMAEIAKLVRLG